jgi:hypothetical protein
MPVTGWTGEDAEGPAPLPVTSMLLDRQARRASPMEVALARSAAADAREIREAADAAPDPDERAAGLVARGVMPGMMSDLSQRLAGVQDELAAEHEKMDKGVRVRARVAGMLERGQIGGLDAARMIDGDFGDAHRAEQLERRAESLRRQLADAGELMAPPRSRQPDPLEAASRAAHGMVTEATRAMAEAAPRRPEPPPFASAGRFDVGDTEHTGADCRICAEGRRRDAARSGEVNVYQMPPDGWEAVRAQDAADGVIRRSTEGGIRGVR